MVFGAYWNNPAATDAVPTDGWFATGDLGSLDDDDGLSVHGLPADTPLSEVVRDPQMRADAQRAVDYVNQAVSRAESIRAFALVEGGFSEENGLLTPSLTAKRHAAVAAYAEEIEALYRD